MPAPAGAITDVTGIEVGHVTDPRRPTGCSVVLARGGAVGGVDVRGAAPGTRETDLLAPANLVERVHAVMLAGGSAFGLAAADGAMRWLEERGLGLDVRYATVPLVPAAASGRRRASPSGLQATSAPTVTPSTHTLAVPMPPFIARAAPKTLPTIAPAPAPTLPCDGAWAAAASQAA